MCVGGGGQHLFFFFVVVDGDIFVRYRGRSSVLYLGAVTSKGTPIVSRGQK